MNHKSSDHLRARNSKPKRIIADTGISSIQCHLQCDRYRETVGGNAIMWQQTVQLQLVQHEVHNSELWSTFNIHLVKFALYN